MAYVNVSAVPVVPVASLPAAAVSPDADVSATGSLPPQPVRTPAAMVIANAIARTFLNVPFIISPPLSLRKLIIIFAILILEQTAE